MSLELLCSFCSKTQKNWKEPDVDKDGRYKSIPTKPPCEYCGGITTLHGQEKEQKVTCKEEKTDWNEVIVDAVDSIINEYHVKTTHDTKQMYFWDNGRYVWNKCISERIMVERLQKMAPYPQSYHVDSAIKLLKQKTITHRDEFNANQDYIPVKNGYLNIYTGNLETSNPDLIYTRQLPVNYDKNATCPVADKIVKAVLGDKADIFWQFAGYTIYPGTIKKSAMMLYGESNTGKTTVANIILWFLGDENVVANSLSRLSEDRWASSTLVDKMVNIGNELSSKDIKDDSIFKAITDGNPIQVEFKGVQPYMWKPTCKLMFTTNTLPKVRDTTNAYYERINLINTNNVFSNGDEDIKNGKWLTEGEKSGILNKAIIGLLVLLKNKRFIGVDSWKDTMEQYTKETDSVEYFILKCVKEDWDSLDHGFIGHDKIYRSYEKFCYALGLEKMNRGKFFHPKNTWKRHFGGAEYSSKRLDERGCCHIILDLCYIQSVIYQYNKTVDKEHNLDLEEKGGGDGTNSNKGDIGDTSCCPAVSNNTVYPPESDENEYHNKDLSWMEELRDRQEMLAYMSPSEREQFLREESEHDEGWAEYLQDQLYLSTLSPDEYADEMSLREMEQKRIIEGG